MDNVLAAVAGLGGFFRAGGPVLYVIFMVSIVLWALIIERYWFYRWEFPQLAKALVQQWQARGDKTSVAALLIRRQMTSQVALQLGQRLGLITTIIAICPLLGLLGTVTGMIRVFDIMAQLGTGNARAMAAGISQATIPTMAGLVVALGGLYFSSRFKGISRRKIERVKESMQAVSK